MYTSNKMSLQPVEVNTNIYTGIWPYDVDFRNLDYTKPNIYNAWNEWDNKKHYGHLMGINPYFGKKIKLSHPYMYTVCYKNSIFMGNPWCYNDWHTMIHDMKHTIGCRLLFEGMTKDQVFDLFAKNPISLPDREIGLATQLLWKNGDVEIIVKRYASDWYNC